jgi:hypothetical protein
MKPNRCPWAGRKRQDAAPFGDRRRSHRDQAIHQVPAGTAAHRRLARPAAHGHQGRNRVSVSISGRIDRSLAGARGSGLGDRSSAPDRRREGKI